MNKIQMYAAAFLLTAGVCFTSCSDDDEASYSGGSVTDTQLKTILAQKGCQFNEQGNLLLDGVAKGITSLDLSGTKIADFSELTILPNLTELDLSDNDYKMSFDFSKLPEQITAVDLTGNELYEFPGLVNVVTAENGDETVTVLRKMTKLYLPESAKYNCNEIPTYFAQNTGADMKMTNASGSLEAYNTLREVPDAGTRAILKNLFPSMFNGDNIDLSKRLILASEKNKGISISKSYIPSEAGVNSVLSVEGVQYIAMNPGYEGTRIVLTPTEGSQISYMKIGKTVATLTANNLSTPILDLSEAINLCTVQIINNSELTTFDMSNSLSLGQRGADMELSALNNPSNIRFRNCEKLEQLILPEKAKIISAIQLISLPILKDLNLSTLDYIANLNLGNLPECNIEYLSYTSWYDNINATFGLSEDIYTKNKKSTKTFLDKYHSNLTCSSMKLLSYGVTNYLDWTTWYN